MMSMIGESITRLGLIPLCAGAGAREATLKGVIIHTQMGVPGTVCLTPCGIKKGASIESIGSKSKSQGEGLKGPLTSNSIPS